MAPLWACMLPDLQVLVHPPQVCSSSYTENAWSATSGQAELLMAVPFASCLPLVVAYPGLDT